VAFHTPFAMLYYAMRLRLRLAFALLSPCFRLAFALLSPMLSPCRGLERVKGMKLLRKKGGESHQ